MRPRNHSPMSTATSAPLGPARPVIEAGVDQAFFEATDATLECMWRRYWLAELGIEKGVVLLARDVRLGGEPWPELS